MESAHIAHRDELFDSAKELGIVESCLIHLMKNVAALVRQFASATHHKRFWHSTHAHTISIKLELVLHDLLRAYVEAFFKVLDPYFGNRVLAESRCSGVSGELRSAETCGLLNSLWFPFRASIR